LRRHIPEGVEMRGHSFIHFFLLQGEAKDDCVRREGLFAEVCSEW